MQLNLSAGLINKSGFVLCLNYFNSGENMLNIKIGSPSGSLKIKIGFFSHVLISRVFIFISDSSFYISEERSNSWIFLCMSFDLINQKISIGLENQNVFTTNLDMQQTMAINNLKNVEIWWENHLTDFKFQEKVSLLNIHSINRKRIEDFVCGEAGDLYSWDVNGWINGRGEQNITISQESTYTMCGDNFNIFVLPKLNFHDTLNMCKNMNGSIFYEDIKFEELVVLEGKRNKKSNNFWIPYTDKKEEGIFISIYTNSTFKNLTKYMSPNQPNGGSEENCLKWDLVTKGICDSTCSYSNVGLCKISNSAPYLVLRGLCLDSQVEKFYTPGNNYGTFIWNGDRYAKIQYYNGSWLMHNVLDNARAESDAPYQSLLIGTHSWKIQNDKKCSSHSYGANLSLRLYLKI